MTPGRAASRLLCVEGWPCKLHADRDPVPDACCRRRRVLAKRCVGDRVTISAEVFPDGHDLLNAVVRYRPPGARAWREAAMEPTDAHLGGARWAADVIVDRIGRWEYTIRGVDRSLRHVAEGLVRKLQAGQHELAGELSEGALLLRAAAAARAPPLTVS